MSSDGLGDLKKLARQYAHNGNASRDTKREQRTQFVLRMYGGLRREIDPLWRPSAGDRKNARLMASRMKRAHVPESRWPEYMMGLFVWFPKIADLAYPPMNVVASQNQIDRFAAKLPRRLDMDRAGRMLKRQGFSDVRVGIVVKIAERLHAGEPDESLGQGRAAEAARWLAQNFDQIGYAEED